MNIADNHHRRMDSMRSIEKEQHAVDTATSIKTDHINGSVCRSNPPSKKLESDRGVRRETSNDSLKKSTHSTRSRVHRDGARASLGRTPSRRGTRRTKSADSLNLGIHLGLFRDKPTNTDDMSSLNIDSHSNVGSQDMVAKSPRDRAMRPCYPTDFERHAVPRSKSSDVLQLGTPVSLRDLAEARRRVQQKEEPVDQDSLRKTSSRRRIDSKVRRPVQRHKSANEAHKSMEETRYSKDCNILNLMKTHDRNDSGCDDILLFEKEHESFAAPSVDDSRGSSGLSQSFSPMKPPRRNASDGHRRRETREIRRGVRRVKSMDVLEANQAGRKVEPCRGMKRSSTMSKKVDKNRHIKDPKHLDTKPRPPIREHDLVTHQSSGEERLPQRPSRKASLGKKEISIDKQPCQPSRRRECTDTMHQDHDQLPSRPTRKTRSNDELDRTSISAHRSISRVKSLDVKLPSQKIRQSKPSDSKPRLPERKADDYHQFSISSLPDVSDEEDDREYLPEKKDSASSSPLSPDTFLIKKQTRSKIIGNTILGASSHGKKMIGNLFTKKSSYEGHSLLNSSPFDL